MTAAEIKAWLALVAKARLAVAQILPDMDQITRVDVYGIDRAEDYLEEAFTAGLEAHGQAVLKEYLADQQPSNVA